jgi:hypothetical protein
VGIDAVLPSPHLLLYLNDPHVAIPFAYRLRMPDQLSLGVGAQASRLHADALALDTWA